MPENAPYTAPEDIVLNSDRDDIQRILGHPPGWTLRWGITAVFFAMLLFLGLGWMIKYPDVVTAPVIIITENPPIQLFARASGKISRLFAADKQFLEEGQVVALLENTAVLSDVDSLENFLLRLESINKPADLMGVRPPERLQLGELQNTYAAFVQSVNDFQFFERQQGVFAQIASLEQQILHLKGLNASLKQQEITLGLEVDLAQKNLNRNRGLLESGTISEVEFERSETNYLQYRRQSENLKTEVLNNRLQIEQFDAQIVSLRQNRINQSMQKWLSAREILDRLKSELKIWKQTYLIFSPIAGRLSLTRFWSPQQFVQANQEIAAVVPGADAGKIIGKALLPTFNSGKVQPGMRTNIQLDGYPYQEFGVIQGEVASIALAPEQENYLLEIKLPDSLITTYKRRIPFTQELPGTARIITEDRRILDRIFDQLISLVRNN